MINMIKLGCEDKHFNLTCSQCRREYNIEQSAVKQVFAESLPSHSKVVDACCGKQFVVSHLPCRRGCYDCDESRLKITDLDDATEVPSSEASEEEEPVGAESAQEFDVVD